MQVLINSLNMSTMYTKFPNGGGVGELVLVRLETVKGNCLPLAVHQDDKKIVGTLENLEWSIVVWL